MKRFILLVISSCVVFFAYAQGEIKLDSIPKIQVDTDSRALFMEKPLLFDGSFPTDDINLFDKSLFSQPLLPDYNKNLDFKKYLNRFESSTETFSPVGFGFSPFLTSGAVYNQATYRINDRFSFGGNSFGVQSVFEQPKMNPSISGMSTKGASMFLQYKVSDKFKVQTRVSISNRQSPWEP